MQIRVYMGLDRRGLETFESEDHPFQITPVGVIIDMGTRSEVLFPWHRIHEISSIDRGTIANNLDSEGHRNEMAKRAGTELL